MRRTGNDLLPTPVLGAKVFERRAATVVGGHSESEVAEVVDLVQQESAMEKLGTVSRDTEGHDVPLRDDVLERGDEGDVLEVANVDEAPVGQVVGAVHGEAVRAPT